MIKASELRLGSWISDIHASGKVIWQVMAIKDSICHYGGFRARYEDLIPIPLTPEILEQCGFFLDEDLGDQKYYQMKDQTHGFGVCFDHDDIELYYFDSMGITILLYDEIHFQSLHHLQNTFIDLAGKELIFQSIKELK